MTYDVVQTFPSGPMPGSGPGKLYVFLHGMICLVETKTGFLGLVVDMKDDHSYRMGDWLQETPFNRGARMKLTGVKPGAGSLNDKNITVIRKPLAPAAKPFATIEFPRPKVVHSLRRTNFPATMLSGSGLTGLKRLGTNKKNFTIAALHVLEYDFEDLTQVALGESPWGPPTVFRPERVATVHFFAEPEAIKPPKHQIQEFHKAAQLFVNFDVTISSGLVMSRLERAEYPPELSSNEALSLIERRFLLSAVAASYKDGTPGELPAPSEGGSGGCLCAPFAGGDS